MKSRIKQQGSALHIVIVIILVLALLGALGFIFWQNFVNKPTANVDNDTTVTLQETTKKKTLTFSQWRVEGDYDDDTVELETAGTEDSTHITDKRLASIEGCTSDYEAGTINRLTADTKISPDGMTAKERYELFITTGSDNSGFFAIAHVGDYYYMYVSPQAACAANEPDQYIQTDAALAVSAVVKSLREVKQ